MDLELLRTFLEVGRTRHFGQAAEALNVTQAAVSARIKHLERLLGVAVFDRSRREVRLTPEGNRLQRYANLLLAEWRKARQEVTAGGAARQLSVGSGPRLWDGLLQEWLVEVRRRDPALALITHSDAQETLVRRLLDGVLDLAFMLDPPSIDSLHVRTVGRLRLVLVADRPNVTPETAVGEGFLLVDWGLAHGLELRRAFPDMPEPHTRLAGARLALACLREFGGAAYLPLSLVISPLRRRRLHRVPQAPVFEREVFAIYPVRSERRELIEAVLAPLGNR
jgi:DNA-binding transcriptional LysR family regulator